MHDLKAVNRDAWVEWQIKFVERLQDKSLRTGWSSHLLSKNLEKEFPRAYKVYMLGMKRSGNHVIVNWITQNCYESQIFFNNMTSFDADLIKIFNAESVSPKLIDRVICTFEHVALDFCADTMNAWCVIRDPYNWLASWLNHTHCDKAVIEKDIKVYINNAEKSTRKILYNEWFKSVEYRNSLASKMGFVNNDIGIDDVPHFGKGSSFDKKRYQGRGSEMDVLNRWKNAIDDPLYLHLINEYYKEFERVAQDLFNMKCPVRI